MGKTDWNVPLGFFMIALFTGVLLSALDILARKFGLRKYINLRRVGFAFELFGAVAFCVVVMIMELKS